MVRIAGIDLPQEKRIDIGLTAIYGIGRVNVVGILKEAKVEPAKRVKDLTSEEVSRLQKVVEKLPVEGTLRKKVSQDIERLKSIKCYRGIRHIQNLPVRGQRTRSNARTKRGKRKTIGAIKKKDMAKFGGEKENES
jgi:small subunit ribosomal protein S13